jgi:hypothetical protein
MSRPRSRAGTSRPRSHTAAASDSGTLAGNSDDIKRFIDTLVPAHTIAPYWEKEDVAQPAAVAGKVEQMWQVRDFSPEQLEALVPKGSNAAQRPKPPRSSYAFFDDERRPTLDNDELLTQARIPCSGTIMVPVACRPNKRARGCRRGRILAAQSCTRCRSARSTSCGSSRIRTNEHHSR